MSDGNFAAGGTSCISDWIGATMISGLYPPWSAPSALSRSAT
jgi:hypothetical protein